MNYRNGKIINPKSLNEFIVMDEYGQSYLVSVYCGYSWNVIQEFHEFNFRNLVGRKVILDFESKRMIAEKDGRGGIQWEKIQFI